MIVATLVCTIMTHSERKQTDRLCIIKKKKSGLYHANLVTEVSYLGMLKRIAW